MFQLEQRYIVPQHGNTVRLLPSALPPRLTNEARGANRAAHERWNRAISLTHTPCTHVLMQKNGVGVPQPCCLNSLQTACDSSPSPFTCAMGAASRLFLRQENRQTHQMHELKFFKSSSDAKIEKGMASARFSRAGTLWNNSVHYAWRYWLPNHTNQRPHCVDYLVNLLMPLSSIAGVYVPVSLSLSLCLSLLLLGRCSVRLVICFNCFLGTDARQENRVIMKSFLLIQHTEGTERLGLRHHCQRGQASELHAPRHLLKYMTVWIMKEEEESAKAVPQWHPSQKCLVALRLLLPPARAHRLCHFGGADQNSALPLPELI